MTCPECGHERGSDLDPTREVGIQQAMDERYGAETCSLCGGPDEHDHEMCLGSDRQTIQSSNGMDDLCVICGESVATNAEGVAYDHLRAPQFKVIPGSRVRFDYLQGGA